MLTVEHLTCRIGSKVILDDVSLSFQPGVLNLIIGPNGAGKSTLVKAIADPGVAGRSGNIKYGGRNLRDFSLPELARIRSVMSQNNEIGFPLTVREVVMLGRFPHFTGRPSRKDDDACEESLAFFNVEDLAGRDYQTLSGGEKQRVHFARVMAQIWHWETDKMRYLILDEPLTFLDVHFQVEFLRKISKLLKSGGLVVVGVVHDLNLAARFADKIVLLNQGKMIAEGETLSVLSVENLRIAYQSEPVIHRAGEKIYLSFD